MKKKIKLHEHQLRQVIREQIFKSIVREAVQKYLVETVDFAALKKELESAYDHFKASNTELKVQPFDWGKITSAFMKDPEAKKMLTVGDADGLVNKMLELFAENPVASEKDIEGHVEKQFGKQTKDDVDDAFDKIQKKAG